MVLSLGQRRDVGYGKENGSWEESNHASRSRSDGRKTVPVVKLRHNGDHVPVYQDLFFIVQTS